jgi:hypothetical protein
MKDRNWQYLVGAVWIGFALAQAGLGVAKSDPWTATMYAGLSIACTLLGASYLWHDRVTVFR